METPFMEVIRFDVENVIATSDGPSVTTHSWDPEKKLVICPQRIDASHAKIITIDSVHDVTCEFYDNGLGISEEPFPVNFFDDPTVDNWYVFDGGDPVFVKCNNGK